MFVFNGKNRGLFSLSGDLTKHRRRFHSSSFWQTSCNSYNEQGLYEFVYNSYLAIPSLPDVSNRTSLRVSLSQIYWIMYAVPSEIHFRSSLDSLDRNTGPYPAENFLLTRKSCWWEATQRASHSSNSKSSLATQKKPPTFFLFFSETAERPHSPQPYASSLLFLYQSYLFLFINNFFVFFHSSRSASTAQWVISLNSFSWVTTNCLDLVTFSIVYKNTNFCLQDTRLIPTFQWTHL